MAEPPDWIFTLATSFVRSVVTSNVTASTPVLPAMPVPMVETVCAVELIAQSIRRCRRMKTGTFAV
ncbi:hypothetical protein [Rhodococcoides fascians]|uniref:hypothetical protein n=1 Tax=Rhodococcoides fascians TaxID=1828 RepID=UPI00050C8A1B|nr:hypothetical protein [Rhodococcus fascians]